MLYCPYCGRKLNRLLINGITTCGNCGHVFDSQKLNKILSTAWMIRREHLCNLDMVRFRCELSEDDFALLDHYIIHQGYSHDEFTRVLNSRIDIHD